MLIHFAIASEWLIKPLPKDLFDQMSKQIFEWIKKNQIALVFVLFGFFKSFRPSEPFLTNYLVFDKHLTKDEVNNKVYPIWDFAHWILIPICVLLAERINYKTVLLMEAFGHMSTRLILIFGNSLLWMQSMQVTFALGTACDLVYYAYVFKVFQLKDHQKWTSYSRASVLLGHCFGSLLGQILVLEQVQLVVLFWISAVATAFACFMSFFFPTTPESKHFESVEEDEQTEETENDCNSEVDQPDDGNEKDSLLRKGRVQVFLQVWKNFLEFVKSGEYLKVLFPVLLYSFNLVHLYLIETYAPSIWLAILKQNGLTKDRAKQLNGFADCGARGLGAIGSFLVYYLLKNRKSSSLKLSRLILLTLALFGATAMTFFETIFNQEIYRSYIFYIVAVGFSSMISSASSAWLGSEVCELKKFGRGRQAIVFGITTFLSSGVKFIVQLIMTALDLDEYQRFWGYSVYIGAVSLLSLLLTFFAMENRH